MVITRKGKVAIGVIGIVFLAYLGKMTWEDRIQKIDRQIYKIWIVLKEAVDRRTQLIPQFAQLMQYYAPQAKEVIDLLNRTYEVANTRVIKEDVLTDQRMATTFSVDQQHIRNALLTMDKVAPSYPNLIQNRHYLLLRTQLQETDKQILYAERTLNGKIQYYNSFIEGFPESWVNKVFFSYQPKIAIIGSEEQVEEN